MRLNANQTKILTFRSTSNETFRSLWFWLKELTVSIVNLPDSQVRLNKKKKKKHILRVFLGPLVFSLGQKYTQNQAEVTWLFKTESRKTIPSRLVSD